MVCRYFPQDSQGRIIILITKKLENSVIPIVIGSGEIATEIGIRNLINSRGHHECTLQHILRTLWENFRYGKK
jgi:hypothetical protein